MIAKCNCTHENQDILHGKGNRVCNSTLKGNLRCTICLKEQASKEISKAKPQPAKK